MILSGGFHDRKAPNYARVMRTRLGVGLVHELRTWDHGPAESLRRMPHHVRHGRPIPEMEVPIVGNRYIHVHGFHPQHLRIFSFAGAQRNIFG